MSDCETGIAVVVVVVARATRNSKLFALIAVAMVLSFVPDSGLEPAAHFDDSSVFQGALFT